MKSLVMSWSSGKDAAYALYRLSQSNNYRVTSLFTTLDAENRRISMHGIREELVEEQATSLRLPLRKMYLSPDIALTTYNEKMKEELTRFRQQNIDGFAFGDLLLEDLKAYRKAQLKTVGLEAVFPIWQQNTVQMADEIINSGIKAIVVAVSAKVLDSSFLGRIYDASFLADLPEGVDPCGEHGEFHTFVYDGPNFAYPVRFLKGEIVKKSYAGDTSEWDTSFYFLDLIPT